MTDLTPEQVSDLVQQQLDQITDPLVREAITAMLVPPSLHYRHWVEGGEQDPCWAVAEHRDSDTLFVYSRNIFPTLIWGIVGISDNWMGMDSNWFETLERAFYDSFASIPLPIWSVIKRAVRNDRNEVATNLTRDQADALLSDLNQRVEIPSHSPSPYRIEPRTRKAPMPSTKENRTAYVEMLLKLHQYPVNFRDGMILSVLDAVIGFGDDILPQLHELLQPPCPDLDLVHVVDALGALASPTSVPCLIEYHRNCSGDFSGLACVHALREIGTDEACAYLSECLVRYCDGDKRAFNSTAEIPVACDALGAWNNAVAIEPLKQACFIESPNHMPEAAIKNLARYREGKPFLLELAESNPSFKPLIFKVINNS